MDETGVLNYADFKKFVNQVCKKLKIDVTHIITVLNEGKILRGTPQKEQALLCVKNWRAKSSVCKKLIFETPIKLKESATGP